MLAQTMGCRTSIEPTSTGPTARCPSAVVEAPHAEPAGEPSPAIDEDPWVTDSSELCEQLANTYDEILIAHKTCSTEADCRYYPDVGLCGATLNTKAPLELLEKLREFEYGYGCPMEVARCLPPNYDVVCEANRCGRG